jgi:hypothetical protein
MHSPALMMTAWCIWVLTSLNMNPAINTAQKYPGKGILY